MSVPLDNNVANLVRQPSLTGEDESDLDFLTELKEAALVPLKEDLSEWLSKLLGELRQKVPNHCNDW